jgi:hypothetical protein
MLGGPQGDRLFLWREVSFLELEPACLVLNVMAAEAAMTLWGRSRVRQPDSREAWVSLGDYATSFSSLARMAPPISDVPTWRMPGCMMSPVR